MADASAIAADGGAEMNNAFSVLLIEDNAGDARLLRESLKHGDSRHVSVVHANSMEAAEKILAIQPCNVILLDLKLPDAYGLEAVRRARTFAPRVTLVVLTGMDDESLALKALQEGAQDYLVKGRIEPHMLLRTLRYAMERKASEEARFFEKERAEATLNCIGEGVICTDASGNITFLNAIGETMTGWSSLEAKGRPIADVYQRLDACTREPKSISKGIELGMIESASCKNCVIVRRDGLEIPVEDSIATIHGRQRRAAGAVIVFRDVSAARAMAQQMAHLAEHDVLTGLPNRMLLNDRVNQAIVSAKRNSKQLAILFLDLDGFKHINDSLGHSMGDRLLKSVAARLVDCGRASDTVSRQGGDEFVVLLSDVQQPEAAAIAAHRMLRAVAEAHNIDSHELHVTTSIGISVYPDDGLDAETLIRNADTAMYQSKENGRQSYQYFKPAMKARAVERQFIEEGLRRALERNEFTLHYQPKLNFKTGKVVGAEALIRWTHPVRGPIPPAQFIPVAESCGLIVPIGNWVLRKACEQACKWAYMGLPPITMAVNASALEFRDEQFLTKLFAVLDETGMDPQLLELEITESVLMKHAESAAAILHVLRDKGVQVAIDDFGTGYSSLSYLQKFPVDALKIDQSFVGEIAAASDGASIVTAVISMARSLKLRVIAEGVETLEQLAFLQGQQCDEAQGYYFSRPVPADSFATLLANCATTGTYACVA